MSTETITETIIESKIHLETKDEHSVESIAESPQDPPQDAELVEEMVLEAVVEPVTGVRALESRSMEQLSESLSQILLTTFDTVTKNLVNHVQNSTAEEFTSRDLNEAPVVQDIVASPSPLAFKVPHPRNPDFVGRISALSQLFGMWNPGQISQARIAIVGLGGVGYVFPPTF